MLMAIKNSIGSKFGKDIAITIAGQIIVLLVAFGLNKVLSIKLGVVGFGEFSIVKRTAGVITFVMLAGMGIAIPKYMAIYRELTDKVKEARFIISGLIIMILLSSVTMILLFSQRELFAGLLFGSNKYEDYILPMLLYSFSLVLTTFAYSYYRGLDQFYKYSISQISVQLLTLAIALLFGGNIIALLYIWSLVTGCYGLYVCVQVWRKYFPQAKIKSYKKDLKSPINELTGFCVPRIPGEFVLFAYTVVPLIIISHKLGMETSAYFAVAVAIITMVNPLFGFVGLVLLPLVSRSIASNQFSDADSKVIMLGKIYVVIGIAGITFVELFTPFVINTLFSSEYQPSLPIVKIVIISILPNAVYLLLRNPLDAMSKIPYNTINLVISFIVLIVLVLLSSNINTIASSFVVAYGLLGLLSINSWRKCKKEIYTASDVYLDTKSKELS